MTRSVAAKAVVNRHCLLHQLGLQQQLEGLLQPTSCLAGLCYCLQGTRQRSFAGAAQQHIWHRTKSVCGSQSGMLLLCAASLLLLSPLLLSPCVLRCSVLAEPQT
jgi:hypothetical protein